MFIAVSGGTGLLGNNVVRAAIDAGHRVRVLARSAGPQECFDGLDVETLVGDVTRRESLDPWLDGVDAVVNSAGLVYFGWRRIDQANAINGEGARNVAAAARARNVRMIHVSTTNTLAIGRRSAPASEDTPGDGQVPCSYVASKRLGDRLVREQIDAGLDAVIVHPGFMLGPWDWKPSSGELVVQLAKTWTPFVPMGGVCLCDPRDVAAAILSAIDLGKTGRNYLLGGVNWTHFQLWRAIAKQLGRRGPWSPIGPVWPAMMGLAIDSAVKLGLTEPTINGAALRLAGQCHFYDSARAIEELGYTLRPPEESIRDSIAWFRQRGLIAPT